MYPQPPLPLPTYILPTAVLTDLLYQNVFKVDTPTPSNVDKTLSKLPPSQPHPQEGDGYPLSRDVLQLLSPTSYRNIATEIFETNKQGWLSPAELMLFACLYHASAGVCMSDYITHTYTVLHQISYTFSVSIQNSQCCIHLFIYFCLVCLSILLVV